MRNKVPLPTHQKNTLITITSACILASILLGFFIISNNRLPKSSEALTNGSAQELKRRLRRADNKVKNKRLVHQAYKSTLQEADKLAAFLPDPSNPYAWATQIAWHHARQHHVHINDINEVYRSVPPDSPFHPYTIRIQLEATFYDARNYIAALEKDNPLLQVIQLDVSSQEQTPEKHSFTILIEWITQLRIQNV